MRKTKLKTRILSWILCVLMAFSAIPTYAAETVSGNDDYDLKVLTFEDGDYEGDANFAGSNDWSSLIDDPQNGGSLLYGDGMGYYSQQEAYTWYDKGNTELTHTICAAYGSWCYWSGGHAVSHYASGDIQTYGDYMSQLTVYQEGISGITTTGGGYNGSDNFAVHFGYMDGSSYNNAEELPALFFGDGEARVIDHMYVNNTTYALNCFTNGNEFTATITENDWVKIVATGYNGDTATGTAEIYLVNGPNNVVMNWTKWDLTDLGEVTKVEFNVLGTSDNGYGFSQPGYFAYDNVAVRFEKESTVCEHTNTETGYIPVENERKHVVEITCTDCTERVGEEVTADCVDENGDFSCDDCERDLSVAVTGVSLDKESVSVNVNETVNLKATVTPENATDRTVSWTSSDETVATIVDGVATGIAAGTATITVSTTDGSFTDTCTVTVVKAVEITGNEIPVADNVIDITDKTIGSISSYYGKAESITIDGADVREAYEDGTTVYVVLTSGTADDATVNVAFDTLTDNFTVEGSTGTVALSGGTGELNLTLDAKYRGRLSKGTATYKLIFLREEIPTVVPIRLKETDTASTYTGVALELNLKDYFSKAKTYYLVNGQEKQALEGSKYTFLTFEGGKHALVFAASNVVGDCPDYVTVTVNVTAFESGTWIGKETSNGSVNYVLFTDADGNKIDGLQATLEGTTINVVLPKDYPVDGKVKASFDLTQTGDLPFITTKNAVSGLTSGRAVNNKFTEKDIALNAGAATFTFYLYNITPQMNNNVYETWKLTFTMVNTLPVLSDDSSATASVEAGENYELDLAPLFTDSDGDSLTYQYKVGDGDWTACDTAFTYSNDLSGEYTLSFRAFDSKGYSEQVYTVTLTVKDSSEIYNVQVTAPAGVAPEFYVSDENGTVGNSLTATASDNIYTVKVPSNVSHIAWRADGMGMSTEVSAGSELVLLKADFKVMAGETVDSDAVVTVKYGDVAATGNANSFLLLDGITYAVSTTASISGFNGASLAEYTPVSGENIISLVQEHFTVIAPADSVVSAGTLSGSFGYNFSTPISVVTAGNTVIYKFAPLSYNAFIRVQRPDDPDAVTYWDYESSKADGKTITVTEEMLFMNDNGDFDSNTVYRNFEKYALDLGDIYMNINPKGYIDMNVGGTKQLNVFRNWQAIESFTNAKIALPDFSYEIITLEGEDVVSIEPNANNSAMAMLTAKNEGTVIVLVTYDAMYSELTATGAGGGAGGANRLSAIWPDRTGVFVVSVGKDGTGITTNMTCNGKAFDAEHSPQFYTGNDGASVSFKPEDDCTVTVNRSTVGNETLSFGEFTADGVTVEEDGTVTVSGLTTGRHIIRVEKDDVYTYQVVTAQQVTVDIKDADGNPVTENTVLNAGDTVTVTVTGLTSPAEKLATAYNFNWQLSYFDDDGNAYKNSSGSTYGRYDFSCTPQKLTVTIPADWSAETLNLNGYIVAGGFSGKEIGGHRDMGYNGSGMASGTAPAGVNLGTLPEITLNVKPAPVPATGVTLDKDAAELRLTENVTLVATLSPENTTDKAVWTSSDETIATVENGVVTGKAAGTVTITVTVGDYSAQCIVTVKAPIAVTEVKLNQTSAKLEPGKLLHLSATVAPEDATDRTVTWTSSNGDVATVDANGVVTAKTEGTAVISAKTGNVSAECTVVVEKKEDIDNMVSVYLSVSHDDKFLQPDASGKVMSLQKVDVPYFDLSLYGLEMYKIPETSDDYGKVTAMHLYIYATEVFYCGVSEAEAGKGYLYQNNILGTDTLTITGSAGSSYMNKFWGYDENLNYYVNYQYPTYSGTTIGATADRIILNDGDIVTIGHFTSWSFYSDPSSIFNYIIADGDTITSTVTQDQQLSLNVYRAGADIGSGGSNTSVDAQFDVYYAKADALISGDVTEWTKLGTTDENGVFKADISALSVGQYIIAVAGRYGIGEYTSNDICSTPGGIILNVLQADDNAVIQNVIAMIDAIGEVTLEDEDTIASVREAYNVLNDTQKLAVTNYAKLQAAEEELTKLQATQADKNAAMAVDKLIADIGEIVLEDENAIKAAREAYDALTDTQKLLVENLAVLEAAEATITELKKPAPEKAEIEKIYKETGNYIEAQVKQFGLTVNSIGGEWIVIGLERSDRDTPSVGAYYNEVVKFVQENANDKEQLHRAKSTENARVILALTALGYDVTNVDGHNLLAGLTDMSYVKKQGINGPIWALIAFDSHDYEIPAVGDVTREKLIETILAAQLTDGGWALSGVNADADMTGMALAALAPYYKTKENVKAAVDKALVILSKMQHEDGSFGSIDGSCSESCAQVIVALTALGINPDTDRRFIKNNISVVDALCAFAVEGGGFKHISMLERNGMATEQGYYALTAYMRFLDGEKSLYDMTDVTLKVGSSSGTTDTASKKDKEAAQKVIDLIAAIGKVTADSSEKITAARKAYNALTAAQKQLVTNYAVLTAAETELKEVLKVQNVIDLIEAIGKVTVNSETRIKRARAAYDALTAAQKKLVDNYAKLLVAEVDLNLAKIDYVEELIDSIGTVNANSKTKINRARTAYNKLPADLKDDVKNYDVLVAAEEAYKKLTGTTKKASTTKKPSTSTTTTVEEDLTVYALSVNSLLDGLTADSLPGEILDAILAYEELTEEEKAALGKDRTIESLKVQFAEAAQTDSKTGIVLSGAEWNIALVVEDVLDLTQAMYLQEKLGKNTMLAIWDIYLEDMLTGKEYQPDGSVLVKIPLAQIGDYSAYDGLAVVHFAADGTVEYLNSMIMGEYLVFNTVDFSNYAVVGYYGDAPADGVMTAATNSADASANMSWIPWTVGGVVGIAALAVILVMQKKNKKVNVGE